MSNITTSRPRRHRPNPAVQGKLNFESKCLACHAVEGGKGKKIGPDMVGVTKRRTDDWLFRWLKSPEKMLATDATAKAMLKEYNNIPMPNQNLPDSEIREYLRYFHWIDQHAGADAKPPTAARPGKGTRW